MSHVSPHSKPRFPGFFPSRTWPDNEVWNLMSPPCLESQGCYLISLYQFLSCSSAYCHCSCCATLSSAFARLAGAVTPGVRPEYKYDIRPQLGAIRQTETEREQTENAGNFALKGESFVVPPVVPLSLLQGSFILGCWRGRYFVQNPTSTTLPTRMCVARTHAKCGFLRFGSSLCLPVDGPGFLSESPEKQFLGKKTLGGTSKK